MPLLGPLLNLDFAGSPVPALTLAVAIHASGIVLLDWILPSTPALLDWIAPTEEEVA